MKLDQLLAEFDDLSPDEALELLVEFSDSLPPLSGARSSAKAPASCRIQECQTPVDLWVDLIDGTVRLEASVPEKSPTVRGFVALLIDGLEGATPDEIEALPNELLPRLGLEATLGMTRRQGFRGIVSRIKRDVARAVSPAAHQQPAP